MDVIEKKCAIVTGASGFIGRALVAELISQGYSVTAVIRCASDSSYLDKLDCQNLSIVRCDLRDYESLARLIGNGRGHDLFFHLAWDGVSGSKASNVDIQLSNISAAIEALRCAKKIGCKRFVGSGSIHEIECLADKEKQATSTPNTVYKSAKLAAHYMCEDEALKLGIEFIWPRITNAYGPGENSSRFLNNFVRALADGYSMDLTEGDQLYNFIYIQDVARAFVLIAESGLSNSDYIIGSEDIRPLRNYLEEAKSIINPDVMLKFGYKQASPSYLDADSLITPSLFQELGFTTTVSFADGIKSMIS